MTRRLFLLTLALSGASPLLAQSVEEKDAAALKPMADILRKAAKLDDKPIRLTIPLFDRVLQFSLPRGYVPVYQAQNRTAFIMEFVPDGDKIESWTKLITITSSYGVGSFTLDDETLAKTVVGGGQCDGYSHFQIFTSRKVDDELGEVRLSSGCGKLPAAAYAFAVKEAGEQNAMRFFRDKLNTYTVQYAERGAGYIQTSLPISNERANAMLDAFGDVLLCQRAAKDQLCKEVLAVDSMRAGGKN